MDIAKKFKETVSSVLPVMVIVIVLGFTVAPLGIDLLLRFCVGGVLLIIGLTIFLIGLDIGILPLGQQCGSELTKKRNLPLLLFSAFVIGFLVTASEPDIQVLAIQVKSVFPLVSTRFFIIMIAVGVALFIMIGLLRTVLNLSLKIILALSYILIFLLAFVCSRSFSGIAFDSGGATTGPMTVPFIMALGVGVSSVRARSENGHDNSEDDSFGLTGMASVGPVMAVLLYGVLFPDHAIAGNAVLQTAHESVHGLFSFISILPHFAKEAATSLFPVAFLFFVFQLLLLKMPPRQVQRMTIGFVYSYIGLVIFLVGVNGGFMSAGRTLGELLGTKAFERGAMWQFLLVATGFIIGAVVVCAEPAVWVLTEQVELISGGAIKRRVLLLSLSVGASVAIGLAMIRAIKNFNLLYVLVPGYALALMLMIFSPKLFTGIAFDSGGVASGPISSTFVLSFTLGASKASGAAQDAFGVIALIAMTPLIAIQILGIAYKKRTGGYE